MFAKIKSFFKRIFAAISIVADETEDFFEDLADDAKEALKKRWAHDQYIHDTLITLGFVVLSLLALIPLWSMSQVIFYFIGILSILVLFAHVARRLLFPQVSMRQLLRGVISGNLAAAATIFAMVVFISVIVYCGTLLVGFKQ